MVLLILIVLLPLFVRTTSVLTQEELSPQETPAALTEPPATEAPLPLSEAGNATLPPEEGFLLEDGTAGPDAAITASPKALAPTADPNTWTYETSSIQVTITRHEQGKFVYFAADIKLTSPEQFATAFSHEKYGANTEALSDIAERHDPLLAINGDFYGFHNNGVIIRGGALYRKNNSSRHLLIVDASGDLSTLTDRSENQSLVADRLMEEGVRHTFEFGPVLVENGEAVKLNSAILRVGEGYLEPRTAIGQYDDPLHYLVIVVDGRSDGYSEGCDLPTLQKLFVNHGVTTAFNLDGGGSTTLWFNGHIINKPSSGDERKVSDIVMFMRK